VLRKTGQLANSSIPEGDYSDSKIRILDDSQKEQEKKHFADEKKQVEKKGERSTSKKK